MPSDQTTKVIGQLTECPECKQSWTFVSEHDGLAYSHLIGVEYGYHDPQHYDGISEWRCPFCNTRWGRWTGKLLGTGESEKRFGGK
jgi:hypothetical protein